MPKEIVGIAAITKAKQLKLQGVIPRYSFTSRVDLEVHITEILLLALLSPTGIAPNF